MTAMAAAVGEIVEMHHHPWGNAYFPTAACGGGPYDSTIRRCFDARCGVASPPPDCYAANMSEIVSQHGPQEYTFNRVQACAKDFTVIKGEAWYTRYWTFVACVEDKYTEGIACTKECAAKANFTESETDYLHVCLETSAGDKSVIREAMATGDHAGTPTVMVAGKESSPYDALKDVCAAYTGPKPAGCHSVMSIEEDRAGMDTAASAGASCA
jgi:hypothetical protein